MDVLTQPDCIFDRQVVQDLFDGQNNGYNNGERLFGLVMFELWRKDYGAVL
jgi:asparagine synthase (glutamine-hydrolysing)